MSIFELEIVEANLRDACAEIAKLTKERDWLRAEQIGELALIGGQADLIEKLTKECDAAKEQTTQMRLACENYPKMVDKLLKERDEIHVQMTQASLRSSYVFSDGPEYTPADYMAEGSIALALTFLLAHPKENS